MYIRKGSFCDVAQSYNLIWSPCSCMNTRSQQSHTLQKYWTENSLSQAHQFQMRPYSMKKSLESRWSSLYLSQKLSSQIRTCQLCWILSSSRLVAVVKGWFSEQERQCTSPPEEEGIPKNCPAINPPPVSTPPDMHVTFTSSSWTRTGCRNTKERIPVKTASYLLGTLF